MAPSLADVNDPKGLEVHHNRGKQRIQESLGRAGRRFLRTGFCCGTAHGEGGLPTVSGVGRGCQEACLPVLIFGSGHFGCGDSSVVNSFSKLTDPRGSEVRAAAPQEDPEKKRNTWR